MRINLRGVEPDMTEHSLDVANVRASFEHQRRHGMAEDVTCARPCRSRQISRIGEQASSGGSA